MSARRLCLNSILPYYAQFLHNIVCERYCIVLCKTLHIFCINRIPMYCDEWLPHPLIIIITLSFKAALHQAPDESGCVREEGRWNSQVWRCVMRHTWREWSLITAAVKRRGRFSSGDRSLCRACTLVSSWVQEGSVEGFHTTRAAGPAVWPRTAPAIRLTGQDAGAI